MARVGITAGEQVTGARMNHLFGGGEHPNPAGELLVFWHTVRRAGSSGNSDGGQGMMVAMIRHLVSNPCQDACGTVTTGELVEGSPVYRCPGCDSTWVDIDEPSGRGPVQRPTSQPTVTPQG